MMVNIGQLEYMEYNPSMHNSHIIIVIYIPHKLCRKYTTLRKVTGLRK